MNNVWREGDKAHPRKLADSSPLASRFDYDENHSVLDLTTNTSLKELKPMAKKMGVASFVGRHADKVKRPISIEEMNEIATAGWAGEIKDQGDTSCERFSPYDPADSLNNEEEIALFLADAAATGDTQYIARAREIAKRARLKNRLRNAS